jgi:ABC-2 type transport system ATP-binding protein
VEAFPGEIQAISVSKPALEDVFIRRTGHRFWSEDRDENSNEIKMAKKRR